MMEELCPDVDVIGIFNKYIGVTVKLDNKTNSGNNIATVKWYTTNSNGLVIVRAHTNQFLDTQEYELDLEDGTTDRYFANVNVDYVYYQLDIKGHQTLVMSNILDHQRNGSEVTKENGFTGKNSNITKKTSRGWEVLI